MARPQLTSIPFKPGVRKDDTPYSSEGYWTDADKVRFVRGYAENIRGTEVFSSGTFIGRCRWLWAWSDLTGLRYCALGTSCQLAVYNQGQIYDITPWEPAAMGSLSGAVSTVAGSDIVTITQAAHGQLAGDTVNLGPAILGPSIAVTAGSTVAVVTLTNHGLANGATVTFQNVEPFAGVAVLGDYVISNVAANTFEIGVEVATAAATGGGGNSSVTVPFIGTGDIFVSGGYKILTAAAGSYTIRADKEAMATATSTGLLGYVYGRTTMTADPFATVNGDNLVNVNIVGHGRNVGDRVIFNGVSAFNGVTIDGEYSVTEVIDADNFKITASTPANATGTGGGAAATRVFLLKCGRVDGLGGYGYGTGGYGNGPYGVGASARDELYPRTWSGGNFGDTLIASPRGERIYDWRPTATTDDFPRATWIVTSPPKANVVRVTAERFVAVAGVTNAAMVYEPMSVRWSGRENYRVWSPGATNDAGELILGNGSYLAGILQSRGQVLIWSDTALYGMAPSADAGVIYAIDQLGTGCGLLGANSAIDQDGIAFWWSNNGAFYAYSGGVPRQLVNPCRQWANDLLAQSQQDKVYAAFVAGKAEVWWYFPTQDPPAGLPNVAPNENSRYLAYNYVEDHWTVGTYDRTAVIDEGVFEFPLGTDSADGKRLWLMERGATDGGRPRTCYLQSAPFDIGDGDLTAHFDRVVLDSIISGGGFIRFWVDGREFPNSPAYRYGPFFTGQTTERNDGRGQARQLAVYLESIDAVTLWRLGNIRVQLAGSSRR